MVSVKALHAQREAGAGFAAEGMQPNLAPVKRRGWMIWVGVALVAFGVAKYFAWRPSSPQASPSAFAGGAGGFPGARPATLPVFFPTTKPVDLDPALQLLWVSRSTAGLMVEGVEYEVRSGDSVGSVSVGLLSSKSADIAWGRGRSRRLFIPFPIASGSDGIRGGSSRNGNPIAQASGSVDNVSVGPGAGSVGDVGRAYAAGRRSDNGGSVNGVGLRPAQ